MFYSCLIPFHIDNRKEVITDAHNTHFPTASDNHNIVYFIIKSYMLSLKALCNKYYFYYIIQILNETEMVMCLLKICKKLYLK